MFIYCETIESIGIILKETHNKVEFECEDGTVVKLICKKDIGIRDCSELMFLEE